MVASRLRTLLWIYLRLFLIPRHLLQKDGQHPHAGEHWSSRFIILFLWLWCQSWSGFLFLWVLVGLFIPFTGYWFIHYYIAFHSNFPFYQSKLEHGWILGRSVVWSACNLRSCSWHSCRTIATHNTAHLGIIFRFSVSPFFSTSYPNTLYRLPPHCLLFRGYIPEDSTPPHHSGSISYSH